MCFFFTSYTIRMTIIFSHSVSLSTIISICLSLLSTTVFLVDVCTLLRNETSCDPLWLLSLFCYIVHTFCSCVSVTCYSLCLYLSYSYLCCRRTEGSSLFLSYSRCYTTLCSWLVISVHSFSLYVLLCVTTWRLFQRKRKWDENQWCI